MKAKVTNARIPDDTESALKQIRGELADMGIEIDGVALNRPGLVEATIEFPDSDDPDQAGLEQALNDVIDSLGW